MKKFIFMRHGYLAGKYKDYSTLTFDEFEDLLLKKVAPSIDKDLTEKVLRSRLFLSEVDFIICSEESRATQTAKLVKEITGINVETSSLLNEIGFTKGIINHEDIIDFDLLRARVVTQLFSSQYSEPLETVKKRFLGFLQYAQQLPYNTMLCITHGWLMRLMYVYAVKKSFENLSLKDLLEANIPDFLDTIEIDIDKVYKLPTQPENHG